MVPAILKASEFVNRNDGKITNMEAFSNAFFPVEGYDKDDIQPLFDKFYEKRNQEHEKLFKPHLTKIIRL